MLTRNERDHARNQLTYTQTASSCVWEPEERMTAYPVITSANVQQIDAPKSPQLSRLVPFLHEQKIPHSFARIEIPFPSGRMLDTIEVIVYPINEQTSSYGFISNRRSHYGIVEATHGLDLVDAFNDNAHRIA